MYKKEDIKPIDVDKHLQKNPKMYFGPKGASEEGIFKILKETAKILGANDIHKSNVGDLCCIGADLDWLSVDNEYGLNETNVFDRIWPFPEAGVNSARIEAIARVYSSVLVSAREDRITIHKGVINKNQEAEINKLLKKHERIICFKYENAS